MATTLDLLRRLIRERVELVLVGGMAGVVHGSSLVTRDLDACVRPDERNVARLLEAVSDLHPLDGRTASAGPLRRNAAEIAAGPDFTFVTDFGRLDVLWEVPGVGSWPQVEAAAVDVDLGEGMTCRVLGLDALIESKRAIARTRDLTAIDELEEIRRRLREPG